MWSIITLFTLRSPSCTRRRTRSLPRKPARNGGSWKFPAAPSVRALWRRGKLSFPLLNWLNILLLLMLLGLLCFKQTAVRRSGVLVQQAPRCWCRNVQYMETSACSLRPTARVHMTLIKNRVHDNKSIWILIIVFIWMLRNRADHTDKELFSPNNHRYLCARSCRLMCLCDITCWSQYCLFTHQY